MSLATVPLHDEHLEDAAALVVAAVDGNKLAGFLVGQMIPELMGERTVYVPEWAHGSQPDGSEGIYQRMYADLSPRWVANGCYAHLITTLACEREVTNAWFWLGFGLVVVDALRDLSPVPPPAARPGAAAQAAIKTRRATPEDVELVAALAEELQRHMATAPAFMAFVERRDPESCERWLRNPDNAEWLAYRGDEVVGYMCFEPASADTCQIIRDEKTVSNTGAFTRASARHSGVGTALLNCGLDWARSAGYSRCAVDFESANVSASRFWLRHFQPVCYSLLRHIDKRVAWANEKRRTW